MIYVLQRVEQEPMYASFKNNIITLFIPGPLADEWTNTDKVGFNADYRGLQLLVEKDFTCLDNVEEDQSDNYPNPLAAKQYE